MIARDSSPPRSSPGSSRRGWTPACSPGARGRSVGELLDRDPAAERHRRAAHGPRAQRIDPGHADPLAPDAGDADEVDPRHRPRRHRHADAGGAKLLAEGTQPRGDRARGVHPPGVGMAGPVRRHDPRAVQAPGRLLRLRARALHARRGLPRRGAEGVRRPVREGLRLPRQLHGQLGSGLALGDLRPRGGGARGHRHALPRSPIRSRTARARSRSPRCAPRRCSPTPRSR